MSENITNELQKQLWNIANELRGKMDADEFRDYILGFIFYKYLSEKINLYANKLLKEDNLLYNQIDENSSEGEDYLEAIQEESLDALGYFLKPSQLYSSIAQRNDSIIEELQTILNSIEQSTMGSDLDISEQDFEDYKSKYIDIYEKVRTETSKEKDSILNDVDFEIELVHRDDVTVYYILSLLKQMVKIDNQSFAKKRKAITDLIAGDISLRSKRELIEKFIDERLLNLEDSEDIEEAFDSYWGEQRLKAFINLCENEKLEKNKIQSIIDEYLFSNQIVSFNQKVDNALLERETLLKRKKTIKRVV